MARVGRGRYRCLRPTERPDNRASEWESVRRAVIECPLPKAWTGPTAVEVWTEGRYTVSPSVFAREFHVAIPRESLKGWEDYLSARGIPFKPRKRIGARVVLAPVAKLRSTTFRGEPVITRSDVRRLIRSRPATYANAEEALAD